MSYQRSSSCTEVPSARATEDAATDRSAHTVSHVRVAETRESGMTDLILQLRWGGRFGNRLLQYAYGATYARRTGAEYWLPSEWEGTRLFAAQPHAVVPDEEIRGALSLTDEWPAGI